LLSKFKLTCSPSTLLQRHSETDENPASQEQGRILEQLLD